MKTPNPSKWIIAVCLTGLAVMMFTGRGFAALTVTTANENGGAPNGPFTPSWSVQSMDSLIAGASPVATAGNFNLETPTAGNRTVDSLTTNTDLTLRRVTFSGGNTTSNNYVTVGNGSGAGREIVYALPATANGYHLTNITTYGGWADSGRDALAHTILYSTVSDTNSFIRLTSVQYNPSVPGSTPTANRAIVADSGGGVIAENVAAVKFVFDVPTVENGFAGIAAITVHGTAAGSVASPRVAVTTTTETSTDPFTPSWTLATPSLIAGSAPSLASGNFTQETSAGTNVLTDGVKQTTGDHSTYATCGANGGSALVYTLTHSGNGVDVTNIVVYSGWGDKGRDGQYYNLSYATVNAPASFIPITTVYLNPNGDSIDTANRVAVSMNDGSPLATGVSKLSFDFSGPPSAGNFDNGYQGFSEIVVQGTNTAAPPPPPSPILVQDVLPAYYEATVGDEVVFEVTFSNTPPASLQWQFVDGGVTNDLSGETGSTLTLANVQSGDTGSYQVKAVNATNGAAVPAFSSAVPLVVNDAPSAVNNVILRSAEQSGRGPISVANQSTNFFPTWTANTNNDLLIDASSVAGVGDFGLSQAWGDPSILSDGEVGYLNYWPGVGSSDSLVTCGINPAGRSMTYTLDTSGAPDGWDLTNIVVYGGWGDSGRNEQKYEILYSTVAAPSTFISLGTFDYNPNNPGGYQSATRVTLVPETGALAQNVYAVRFNWDLVGAPPKNGYEGYSEIVVEGVPGAPTPVLTQDITPLTADDVVGSTLVLEAGFSGATGYQWQKNGIDIPGAVSPTLTLSNLQLSDTATNGGYRLVAMNGSGSSMTRACAVRVNPVPAPVDGVVISLAHQTSDAGTFEPTWDPTVFFGSLIDLTFPSEYGTGDFTDPDANPESGGLAGGLPVLTDADYGEIVPGGPHPAFATCGPSAGQFVVYTLPASTYGHNITNLKIAGGWNDSGRDDLWSTILYSTVANPTTFIPIAVVTNKPVVNAKSTSRATLTSTNGFLASNVYAIKVDFTTPPGCENGYVGVSEIGVFGELATTNPLPSVVSVENQSTNEPTWSVETPSLIAGTLPSSTGGGSFAGGFNGEPNTIGLPALTDGSLGPFDMGVTNFATCGGAFGAGTFVTYTAPPGVAWTLTNIVVYSGWGNYGRDGQFYDVLYRTYDDLATTQLLEPVTYNPVAPSQSAQTNSTVNRVQIAPVNGSGALATNVYSITFDFSVQTGGLDNGYSGYSEIVVQGSTSAAPAFVAPVLDPIMMSGGSLILAGTGGTPGADYTWLTSTNVAAPIATWTTNTTGVLDGSGSFSNAIPVDLGELNRYFRMRLP